MDIKDIFYISEENWYNLQSWAKLSYDEDKNEISGLMTAIPQKDGRIKIGDVEILKQENTATNTELDGDAVSQYTMKYGMKYKNPNMKFVWWHSHHTMGAFWSGTDEKEIDAWKNESYSLALVINLKEEYVFRVSFWKHNGLPMEKHIDTTLNIEREKPLVNITRKMRKDYKELCTSPKVITTYNNGWNKDGWGNIHQSNLWTKSRVNNTITDAYMECLSKCESLQQSFTDGTISFKDYKSEIIKMNVVCDKLKMPFKVIDFNLNKNQLLNKLMELLPNDMIEFDDNQLKNELEVATAYGGYHVY